MPPNPPSKAHGFAMRSMSLRDMQIPKSEKKILGPPRPPNPGDAPAHIVSKETNLRGLHIVSGENDLRRAPYILWKKLKSEVAPL